MWARRSHILNRITALTLTKVKFKWTDMEQKMFSEIKRNVAQVTLLAYPEFTKRFDIHMDASNHQLGAVISQK